MSASAAIASVKRNIGWLTGFSTVDDQVDQKSERVLTPGLPNPVKVGLENIYEVVDQPIKVTTDSEFTATLRVLDAQLKEVTTLAEEINAYRDYSAGSTVEGSAEWLDALQTEFKELSDTLTTQFTTLFESCSRFKHASPESIKFLAEAYIDSRVNKDAVTKGSKPSIFTTLLGHIAKDKDEKSAHQLQFEAKWLGDIFSGIDSDSPQVEEGDGVLRRLQCLAESTSGSVDDFFSDVAPEQDRRLFSLAYLKEMFDDVRDAPMGLGEVLVVGATVAGVAGGYALAKYGAFKGVASALEGLASGARYGVRALFNAGTSMLTWKSHTTTEQELSQEVLKLAKEWVAKHGLSDAEIVGKDIPAFETLFKGAHGVPFRERRDAFTACVPPGLASFMDANPTHAGTISTLESICQGVSGFSSADDIRAALSSQTPSQLALHCYGQVSEERLHVLSGLGFVNELTGGQCIPHVHATTQAPTTPSPTFQPTTERPSPAPTFAPSSAPTTNNPTHVPSFAPTTERPSFAPTFAPSSAPTTGNPSAAPSHAPSHVPTTGNPSDAPSHAPTTGNPSAAPSAAPSIAPTRARVIITFPPTASGVAPTAAGPTVVIGSGAPTSAPALAPTDGGVPRELQDSSEASGATLLETILGVLLGGGIAVVTGVKANTYYNYSPHDKARGFNTESKRVDALQAKLEEMTAFLTDLDPSAPKLEDHGYVVQTQPNALWGMISSCWRGSEANASGRQERMHSVVSKLERTIKDNAVRFFKGIEPPTNKKRRVNSEDAKLEDALVQQIESKFKAAVQFLSPQGGKGFFTKRVNKALRQLEAAQTGVGGSVDIPTPPCDAVESFLYALHEPITWQGREVSLMQLAGPGISIDENTARVRVSVVPDLSPVRDAYNSTITDSHKTPHMGVKPHYVTPKGSGLSQPRVMQPDSDAASSSVSSEHAGLLGRPRPTGQSVIALRPLYSEDADQSGASSGAPLLRRDGSSVRESQFSGHDPIEYSTTLSAATTSVNRTLALPKDATIRSVMEASGRDVTGFVEAICNSDALRSEGVFAGRVNDKSVVKFHDFSGGLLATTPERFLDQPLFDTANTEPKKLMRLIRDLYALAMLLHQHHVNLSREGRHDVDRLDAVQSHFDAVLDLADSLRLSFFTNVVAHRKQDKADGSTAYHRGTRHMHPVLRQGQIHQTPFGALAAESSTDTWDTEITEALFKKYVGFSLEKSAGARVISSDEGEQFTESQKRAVHLRNYIRSVFGEEPEDDNIRAIFQAFDPSNKALKSGAIRLCYDFFAAEKPDGSGDYLHALLGKSGAGGRADALSKLGAILRGHGLDELSDVDQSTVVSRLTDKRVKPGGWDAVRNKLGAVTQFKNIGADAAPSADAVDFKNACHGLDTIQNAFRFSRRLLLLRTFVESLRKPADPSVSSELEMLSYPSAGANRHSSMMFSSTQLDEHSPRRDSSVVNASQTHAHYYPQAHVISEEFDGNEPVDPKAVEAFLKTPGLNLMDAIKDSPAFQAHFERTSLKAFAEDCAADCDGFIAKLAACFVAKQDPGDQQMVAAAVKDFSHGESLHTKPLDSLMNQRWSASAYPLANQWGVSAKGDVIASCVAKMKMGDGESAAALYSSYTTIDDLIMNLPREGVNDDSLETLYENGFTSSDQMMAFLRIYQTEPATNGVDRKRQPRRSDAFAERTQLEEKQNELSMLYDQLRTMAVKLGDVASQFNMMSRMHTVKKESVKKQFERRLSMRSLVTSPTSPRRESMRSPMSDVEDGELMAMFGIVAATEKLDAEIRLLQLTDSGFGGVSHTDSDRDDLKHNVERRTVLFGDRYGLEVVSDRMTVVKLTRHIEHPQVDVWLNQFGFDLSGKDLYSALYRWGVPETVSKLTSEAQDKIIENMMREMQEAETGVDLDQVAQEQLANAMLQVLITRAMTERMPADYAGPILECRLYPEGVLDSLETHAVQAKQLDEQKNLVTEMIAVLNEDHLTAVATGSSDETYLTALVDQLTSLNNGHNPTRYMGSDKPLEVPYLAEVKAAWNEVSTTEVREHGIQALDFDNVAVVATQRIERAGAEARTLEEGQRLAHRFLIRFLIGEERASAPHVFPLILRKINEKCHTRFESFDEFLSLDPNITRLLPGTHFDILIEAVKELNASSEDAILPSWLTVTSARDGSLMALDAIGIMPIDQFLDSERERPRIDAFMQMKDYAAISALMDDPTATVRRSSKSDANPLVDGLVKFTPKRATSIKRQGSEDFEDIVPMSTTGLLDDAAARIRNMKYKETLERAMAHLAGSKKSREAVYSADEQDMRTCFEGVSKSRKPVQVAMQHCYRAENSVSALKNLIAAANNIPPDTKTLKSYGIEVVEKTKGRVTQWELKQGKDSLAVVTEALTKLSQQCELVASPAASPEHRDSVGTIWSLGDSPQRGMRDLSPLQQFYFDFAEGVNPATRGLASGGPMTPAKEFLRDLPDLKGDRNRVLDGLYELLKQLASTRVNRITGTIQDMLAKLGEGRQAFRDAGYPLDRSFTAQDTADLKVCLVQVQMRAPVSKARVSLGGQFNRFSRRTGGDSGPVALASSWSGRDSGEVTLADSRMSIPGAGNAQLAYFTRQILPGVLDTAAGRADKGRVSTVFTQTVAKASRSPEGLEVALKGFATALKTGPDPFRKKFENVSRQSPIGKLTKNDAKALKICLEAYLRELEDPTVRETGNELFLGEMGVRVPRTSAAAQVWPSLKRAVGGHDAGVLGESWAQVPTSAHRFFGQLSFEWENNQENMLTSYAARLKGFIQHERLAGSRHLAYDYDELKPILMARLRAFSQMTSTDDPEHYLNHLIGEVATKNPAAFPKADPAMYPALSVCLVKIKELMGEFIHAQAASKRRGSIRPEFDGKDRRDTVSRLQPHFSPEDLSAQMERKSIDKGRSSVATFGQAYSAELDPQNAHVASVDPASELSWSRTPDALGMFETLDENQGGGASSRPSGVIHGAHVRLSPSGDDIPCLTANTYAGLSTYAAQAGIPEVPSTQGLSDAIRAYVVDDAQGRHSEVNTFVTSLDSVIHHAKEQLAHDAKVLEARKVSARDAAQPAGVPLEADEIKKSVYNIVATELSYTNNDATPKFGDHSLTAEQQRRFYEIYQLLT